MHHARKNDLLRKQLSALADDMDERAQELRECAGFQALEAVEMERSPENAGPAAECRERALRLSAQASGLLDAAHIIRRRYDCLVHSETPGSPRQ
jgi:hypothetical protein